jgi:hypothetical protein
MHGWRRVLFVLGSLLGLVAGAKTPTQAQDASAGFADIIIDREGPAFTIRPTYALPDTATAGATELRYELIIERTGISTSRSRQSGSFVPKPGRTDTLSTVRIGGRSGDRLHVHLLVRHDDQIVEEIVQDEDLSMPE